MQVPWLTDAKNVYYEFDGGPHKVGGTATLNSVATGATSTISGLYDYWRQGTGGAPSQRTVLHTDTRIGWMDSSGTFTQLQSGLTNAAVPNYATFQDLLLIGSDSTSDVPMSWDQTTFQNLAGTPPRFSFSVAHKNKMFAAGDWTHPSRLYYSVTLAGDDWAGAGSGSIDINPQDGDMITGIISHKGDLVIFKGPNKGSIHILTGSSSSDFAVAPFIYGLGAVWQNGIFRFGDDVGWVSPFGTVHSLNATAAFGNFNQSYLSFPINTHIRDNVNASRLRHCWAVTDPLHNYTVITYANSGFQNNDHCLVMDYRWLARNMTGYGTTNGELYPRWSLWDAFSYASLALVVDTGNRQRIWAGTYAGQILKTDQTDRSTQGLAINETVTLPFLTYGMEWNKKTVESVSVGIQPKNGNPFTFGWSDDSSTQQTVSMTQMGADTLG